MMSTKANCLKNNIVDLRKSLAPLKHPSETKKTFVSEKDVDIIILGCWGSWVQIPPRRPTYLLDFTRVTSTFNYNLRFYYGATQGQLKRIWDMRGRTFVAPLALFFWVSYFFCHKQKLITDRHFSTATLESNGGILWRWTTL